MKRKLNTVFVSALIFSFLFTAGGCRVRVDVPDPTRAARGVAQLATESRSDREATVKDEKLYSDLVPAFAGSEVHLDDRIGFEEYFLVVSESSVNTIAGTIRRQFYAAPEGRSPFEIYRFYLQTIEEMGGEIIFQTREPRSIEIDGQSFISYYNKEKRDHRPSNHRVAWDYYRYDRVLSEYIAAKISKDDADVYLAISAGRGARGPYERLDVVFEVVTVVVE